MWLVFWVYGVIGGNLIGYAFEKAEEVLSPFLVYMAVRGELESNLVFHGARYGRGYSRHDSVVDLERAFMRAPNNGGEL